MVGDSAWSVACSEGATARYSPRVSCGLGYCRRQHILEEPRDTKGGAVQSSIADLGDAQSEHGGLSPLGRAVIAELNRLGMLVDVAHAARETMLEAASLSRTPVVSTHSCTRALCEHPRNMDDAQLDVLRDSGGVIQITAVAAFLKSDGKPETVTVRDFADHIDYAVRRIGVEHVGI